MRGKGVVVTVVGIGVLLAAAGGAWYVMQEKAPQPGTEAAAYEPMEAAQIIEAREIDWQPMADMVGTVIAIRSVAVRNELAGVVREVGYQSGDIVEEGQVLLRQDETSDQADLEAVRASVRVAEASVTQARSEIELAKTELERLIGVPSGAIAAVEIDRARNTLETAKADLGRWVAEVDQANARVAQIEARIAKLTIRAPFRARAGLRTVHEGQYLAEGADVVTLQEVTEKIYLDFAVPQEYAARVVPGTIVMANGELLGPEPAPIEVVASDATVNNQTRNLRVRAIVNNPGGLLVPGMFVQVEVPIDSPQRFVVVPTTAVRRAAYANSVFVIAPDESGTVRAHQRYVSLGQTVGEDVIVLDGLKPGEKIAAAGSFKLRDGVAVMVAPPGQSGAAGSAPTDEPGVSKTALAGD